MTQRSKSIWKGAVIFAFVIAFLVKAVIPAMRTNLAKTRLKRTMSDMRSLGTALGSYQVDYNGYPANNGDVGAALRTLIPDYLETPLWEDGWKRQFDYNAPASSPATTFAQSYTLTSYGHDGIEQGWQRDMFLYFECDIIYGDGQFKASPFGVCAGPGTPIQFIDSWLPGF